MGNSQPISGIWTQLNIQSLSLEFPLTPIFVAAAGDDGNQFFNNEETFLYVKNNNVSSSRTITIRSLVDCDYNFTHDMIFEIPAQSEKLIGFFNAPRFNDYHEFSYILYSDNTDVSIAAIRVDSDKGVEVVSNRLLGKVTNKSAVSSTMPVYTHFNDSDIGWETPILSETRNFVHVESVIRDSEESLYFVLVFGNTANKSIRIVKVSRDGTTLSQSVGFASSQTPQSSTLRLNHDESVLYFYRVKSISSNNYFAINPSTLAAVAFVGSSDSKYRTCDFKISADNDYIWYNAGSLSTDVRIMKISDQSTVLQITPFPACSIHLTSSDVAWRASSDTTGKIGKYTESGGVISETVYSNTDIQYIRHIIMDNDDNLICLQRDGSGNSKLFKVDSSDGQTLFTYDFGIKKNIYNISIDGYGRIHVDRVDGAIYEVLRFDASIGAFSTPVVIGDQANNYDNCYYL